MNNNTDLNKHFDIEVQQLLQSVAKEQGFADYAIKKAVGTMKGEGYLGVITAIEMSGLCGTKPKVLELVVKTASKSEALRGETPIADIFQREIYMYNTVIPHFRKFQTEVGVPVSTSFAKCYKTAIIDKSEALILENLKSSGFKLWERRMPMNEEHVSFVMREYGRYHALSVALRDRYPEKFGNLTKSFADVFVKFFERGGFLPMFKTICYKAGETLHEEQRLAAQEIFKRFVDNLGEFVKNLPELVDYYSVVLHGDCWINNMLFGYDNLEEPTSPTRMCFIDLQLARLGPPVLDIASFFYACSSKDMVTNYQYYLDIYYNSLSDYLKKLGSDPDKLYPYAVFRGQWRESAKFGLLMSPFLIKLMLSEQDEVTDLADAADSGKSVVDAFCYDIAKSDEYNDRVKHLILHFVNNKLI